MTKRLPATPLSFRPSVERLVAIGLSVTAAMLWLVVLPLEFVLG